MKKKVHHKDSGASKEFKKTNFPVVGIGASAGGLEAIEVFFKNLPGNVDMAFVIIQHLDPTRKGILPELIQHFTPLKVIPVKENLKIKPGCVYVIPSNTNLSISKRILHLAEPVQTRGLRLPIDFFFNSLAEDIKDKSVGIILSGMGTDGSIGLASIKKKSGLVLVQEPSDAKFDSMPGSAVESVQCDYVAPVEQLPKILLDYFQYKPEPQPVITEKDTSALDEIIVLLHEQKGHDFTQYKD
ncbi:MAG: chemotaxis protein CheB, partial [Methanococcaceae archaeon]